MRIDALTPYHRATLAGLGHNRDRFLFRTVANLSKINQELVTALYK